MLGTDAGYGDPGDFGFIGDVELGLLLGVFGVLGREIINGLMAGVAGVLGIDAEDALGLG